MTSALAHRSLRIAWIVQGNEGYGVRRAVLGLAMAVRERGVEPLVVTVDDGPFASECRALGLNTRTVALGPAPNLQGTLFRRLLFLPDLIRYERRGAPQLADAVADLGADAVHVIWPNLVGLAGRAARRLDLPCFWELANYIASTYPFHLNRRIYQAVCRRFRVQPLANSHYTAATLGDRPVRTKVCHLGADARQFDPRGVLGLARTELGIPDQAIVFSIVGRLNPSKGQDRVLAAMLGLGPQDPPLHLLLLGGPTDGTYAASLQDMARHAGATGRLHLAGLVGDPQRWYAATDVAVNSRVDAEPFGLSVVEAMLMERPVLVHALGGPAETVVDGVTGWHVADPTVASFAAGLRRALADRARWPALGQAGRARALDQFTTAKQAARYLAVVEEVRSRWDRSSARGPAERAHSRRAP